MYGEFFDIPKPDDLVFVSWYRGGEVFRSGCTWTRGYGRMFYFPAPDMRRTVLTLMKTCVQIIRNAVNMARIL